MQLHRKSLSQKKKTKTKTKKSEKDRLQIFRVRHPVSVHLCLPSALTHLYMYAHVCTGTFTSIPQAYIHAKKENTVMNYTSRTQILCDSTYRTFWNQQIHTESTRVQESLGEGGMDSYRFMVRQCTWGREKGLSKEVVTTAPQLEISLSQSYTQND